MAAHRDGIEERRWATAWLRAAVLRKSREENREEKTRQFLAVTGFEKALKRKAPD